MSNRSILLSLVVSSVFSLAQAQTFNCTLVSSPKPIRAESVADRVGDLAIACTGGSLRGGGTAATANIAVTLSVPVTSRILGSNNLGTLTEALLLIDDPAPGNQFPCAALSCPFVIGQPLGNGANENRNIYQGVLSSANTVTFFGVPIVQPGLSLSRTFHIVNLRAPGVSVGTAPSVVASVAATGTATLPISTPTASVAFVQSPVAMQQTDASLSTAGIPPVYNATTPVNPVVNASTAPSFVLGYSENDDAPSFFRRNPGTSLANPGVLIADNDPFFYGLVETGFYNPTFTATNGLNQAGLATRGTRFEARFTGIPAGVSLFAATRSDTSTTSGDPLSVALVDLTTGSQIPSTVTIAGGTPMAQLTVTGGAATAVWEVFGTPNSDGLGRFYFPIVVSYSSLVSGATVSVGTSLGAVETGSPAASSTAPVPRFTAAPPFTAFTINGTVITPPSITTSTLPNGQQGLAYGPVNLCVNGGQSPYSWNVVGGALPGGVTLSTSGALSGIPTANGTFNFTARVTDGLNQTANANLSLVVRPPVAISSTSVPDGQVGVVYTSTTLTATGGLSPYAWSVGSGTTPPGVTLSTGGTLSGTPTTSGTFSFQARVTDSAGQIANVTLAPVIRPRVSISTTTLPGGQQGVPYSADVVGAGGSLPYAFSLATGSLPGGLTIAANGRISGTPTASGTFGFGVTVTDGVNQTATAALSIVIGSGPVITTTTLPGGRVGVAYPSTNLLATGGTLPLVWSISAGALPGGLTLSAGGAISGTPTASGTFNFTARVRDNANLEATANLSIVIQPPLTITTTTLPGGRVGVAYPSTNLLATGGVSPLVWSISAGALPGGLTLSAGGTISGTPTAGGTFNFTARVRDNINQEATANLSIVVQPPLTITTLTLPGGQVGVAYPSTTLLASGGTPAYFWSLRSGALPAGLSLSDTGTITGTPTTTGSFSFRVRVFDRFEDSADADFTIAIQSSLTITTTSVPAAQVGILYSANLLRTGGAAPFTWTIAQGGLPPGLTLSPAGAITGSPTAGGLFTFTARVADAQGFTADASLSITSRNRTSVQSQVLPDAELNRQYSAVLVAAGGLAPFTWRLAGANVTAAVETTSGAAGAAIEPQAAGDLPPGLALSSGGVLSGVPSVTGNFTFTVIATDSVGQQATGDIQIIVRGGFSIPNFTLPAGAVECNVSTVVQATGGTPPYTWSAIGLPVGVTLSPSGRISGLPQSDGFFVATVIATDANGQSTRQEVRFTVAPALAIVSPESIDPVGAEQSVPVAFGASGGTPPYSFSADGGTLPSGLSIDSQGLIVGRTASVGTFGFGVKVTDACGTVARRSYPVRVLPSRLSECSISPQPESLKFTVTQGTGAVTQSIGLPARCATPLSLSVSVEQSAAGQSWLSAGQGPITASALNQAGVSVTANPGSLPVGTYAGSVSFGGAVAATVPVLMTVAAAPVSMQVSPVGLTFTAVQNGPNPAPQTINVVALPQGPLSWSAATSTTSGGQWFTLSAGAGTVDTGAPGLSSLQVRVSPAGLAPGEYYGTIEFSASGAANSSRSVTVVLNVLPSDRPISAVPTPDQSGFIITGSAARTVNITNPSRSPLTFTTSRHAVEGRLWFSVDPGSGTIGSGSVLSIRITPDPASLNEPGVRRSLLVIRFSDSSVITIELVQVVPRIAAPRTIAAVEVDSNGNNGGGRSVTGCTPSRLVGVFTTLQQNFSIPVGWPTGVDMEIVDDCTDPFTAGSATLGFSCCDSPKAMIPLRQGRWSTTWVARAPQNTEVAVTGDFANDGRSFKGTHAVSGVIARTGNPPVIAPGGALSGATFSRGQALAPGILASVFGQRFADELTVAPALPLSTTLGATSISLGGKLLPLFFTSDGQVNTQTPFDLPANTELSLIVRRGAALSAPETVTIAPAAPGMFTRNQQGTGQAAVVDVQGRVIAPGNAAPSGGVAILFATGLGAVDQPVLPGFPAPGAEPLARTIAPVSVSVGGLPAQVLYSGLAPGFVGLYQINFLIPSGVTPGDAVPLTISTIGATSTPGTLAIR